MSSKVTTNFGAINGRRVVTFKVSEDGIVPVAGWRHFGQFLSGAELREMGKGITAHESFRRWKVARKAWHTRKWKNQLSLPL